jgi:hypothetical protein
MYEKKDIFDARLIQEPLAKILAATANKLEREWPTRYQLIDSARVVFFTRIRIAMNTYQAIMYLVATSPKDPLRDPRFVLVTPMLVRSLFEELITIVFLLHDVSTYIPYLFKTGYKERWLDLQFRLNYHAAEPEWQESINRLKDQMTREAAVLQLTPREIADPDNSFGRWPQPPKMLSMLQKQHPTSPAIPFIKYMNDWIYRKLSGQTHLDRSGLIQKGIHFSRDDAKLQFGDEWERKLEEELAEYCTEQMHLTWAILLSIATEIEAHFRYELKERALFIWHSLIPYSDYSAEFFQRRYQQLLDYN